ncbi:hypothetical protein MTO96_028218 [Rhipicephalus appendiculatus]
MDALSNDASSQQAQLKKMMDSLRKARKEVEFFKTTAGVESKFGIYQGEAAKLVLLSVGQSTKECAERTIDIMAQWRPWKIRPFRTVP